VLLHRRQHRGFTPEAIANIRQRYENTDEPQDSIASDFGIHRKTLNRLAKDQGWTLRKERAPRDLPTDLRLAVDAEQAVLSEVERTAEVPPLAMAERLERAVAKELAAVELMRARLGPEPASFADAERTARTLERLTEALSKARRLRLPESAATESTLVADMPADIDEFRHALALRIEAFVRSRSDDGLSGAGGPSERNTAEQ